MITIARRYTLVTSLALVFISTVSLAADITLQESLIQKSRELDLASEKKWHKLMHYYTPSYIGGLRSYVDDDDFFIAKSGKTEPVQELEADIVAFFEPAEYGNFHAICRFPARFTWIVSALNETQESFPQPDCEEYNAWREQVSASRLSLIFPSAYINSPSSMFGHTLFRFDPANVEEGTDWLSWSLSFGAYIDDSDNSIEFAYRGIFGGYRGIYNMTHYFKKIKEYNHLENRDIWEYELDISAEGVDEMLTHTWELKETNFDYYFLDENCAFRLLEQIELVRDDVSLTDKFGLTAIPADTVRAILDEGLVTSANFKPSATTVLKSRINELSDAESRLAKALSEDISLLTSEEYTSLGRSEKSKVVQVAFSYLRFKQLKMYRDEAIAKRSHELLLELNTLPSEPHVVEQPARPEKGHKTQMVGATLGLKEDLLYAQFDYRVTYHDLLDNPEGYPKGAHIAMGNTQIRYTEGEDVEIQRFDFIDIISLSAMDLFFNSPSWHVKTGYEKVFAQNERGLAKNTGALYVKAGGGAATNITPSVMTYLFADARLENNSLYKPFINTAFGLSGGVLAYNSWGTLKMAVESDYFLNDDYRAVVSVEQNFILTTNDAFRIGLFQEWYRDYNQYEVTVAYRHHF